MNIFDNDVLPVIGENDYTIHNEEARAKILEAFAQVPEDFIHVSSAFVYDRKGYNSFADLKNNVDGSYQRKNDPIVIQLNVVIQEHDLGYDKVLEASEALVEEQKEIDEIARIERVQSLISERAKIDAEIAKLS